MKKILLAILLMLGLGVVNANAISATGGYVTNYTQGGTNFTAHIFTNTAAATSLVFSVGGDVELLVVAGGGGGGGGYQGSGGGAGGFRNFTTNLQAVTYTITVGAGGLGCIGNSTIASNGTSSLIMTGAVTVVSTTGGGRGGSETPNANPASGGSGGGGMRGPGTNGISGEGYAGGSGATTAQWPCGGGGGASSVGSNGVAATTVGLGGLGASNSLSGTAVLYATGGKGGWRPYNLGQQYTGASGAANTGTGGEGGGGRNLASSPAGNGGNGGSGIIIVRYVAGGAASIPYTGIYRQNTIFRRNTVIKFY
jgi:hypothetical protein